MDATESNDLPEILTTGDVAKAFGVRRVSVRQWAAEGKLRSFETPGGHRRFYRRDIEKFLEAK